MDTESIAVRRAGYDDAESIASCLAQAFEPFRLQYTDEAFRDTIPDHEGIRERLKKMTIYVAVATDGIIVGTLAGACSNHGGHLRGMAVRPEWQGLQIAQKLLAQAEADFLEAGCTRVTLDTTLPLKRAIHFYEKNGFTYSGCIRDFFGMELYEFAKTLEFDSRR